MAQVTSLGVHTPVALPYLIREGILPPQPKPGQYQWQTYTSRNDHNEDGVDEEILTTDFAVAWSQGSFVRNIFRFDLDGEVVVSAILSDFDDDEPRRSARVDDASVSNGYDAVRNAPKLSSQSRHRPSPSGPSRSRHRMSRGLVVLLKTKLHIFFLGGRSHIVDLPFDIETIFPAPRGIILQRKVLRASPDPPSSQFLRAPPNSFFASQAYSTASFLQSPTLIRSLQTPQPSRPSPLGAGSSGKLDALYRDITGPAMSSDEEGTANLFSLSSPLSDLGIVFFSSYQPRPRFSTRSQAASGVEFEPLDPAERVIYVSERDELHSPRDANQAPLILVVTVNEDFQTVNFWHAWYVDDCSLAQLVKQRALVRDSKARRRSSFMSTGATTPAPRAREGIRESFAAVGSLRLQADAPTTGTSRKVSKVDEAAAMAFQMDLDYQPGVSQNSIRDNRRISSNTVDLRAVNPAASTVYNSRRHTSFGPSTERKSFGLRKSRASTPGSVFSKSVGAEEDSMDLDGDGNIQDHPSTEHVLRHVRASIEAAGADNIFGTSEERFRREFIVRRLHSTPLLASKSPEHPSHSTFKVVTLCDHDNLLRTEREVYLYFHEKATGDLSCLKLRINMRLLWSDMPTSSSIPIPVPTSEVPMGNCSDITVIRDGPIEALLMAGKGLRFPTVDTALSPLPPEAPYRAYSELRIWNSDSSQDPDVGKNRLLSRPAKPLRLAHPSSKGLYDEDDGSGSYHRRQMRLKPHHHLVRKLLQVLRLVLPGPFASAVNKTWCIANARLGSDPARLSSTAHSAEWVALVATVFLPVIALLDPKARASVKVSAMSAGKQSPLASGAVRLRKRSFEGHAAERLTMVWMSNQNATASISPRLRSSKQAPKDQCLVVAAALADDLSEDNDMSLAIRCASTLMLALHIWKEEQRLELMPKERNSDALLTAVILQLGHWLGLSAWSPATSPYYGPWSYKHDQVAFVQSASGPFLDEQQIGEPVGFLDWFGSSLDRKAEQSFPLLSDIAISHESHARSLSLVSAAAAALTPRIAAICAVMKSTNGLTVSPAVLVETLARHDITKDTLDSFPEAISAPLQEAMATCEQRPPTTWGRHLLHLVGREDLAPDSAITYHPMVQVLSLMLSVKDIQSVCSGIEQPHIPSKSREAHRHAISQLIFREDRRLVEAMSLMHYNSVQVAECPKQPDWTDAQHFEFQRRLMQWVTTRMIALPAGDAMIHYDSQAPLLAEKYHVPGFSSSCIMQPMRHVMTTDRSGLTEEKVSWAYFHAGVSAGLRISRQTKGIDTSWVAFNKPSELTNRHAGLLLALGLGGHLRSLAKWLSFKYLTPKHNMTSVGLLLGLSASYIGTADSLVTRMLSVHITRMLPAGAAELNVSPMTQTAGLMGIGLLYHDTQHRRMSEIMLSEIEHMEAEDPDSGPDPLRDESYRLAAGFAFGLINLAKGHNMSGLHGMYSPERLLAIAVGPRPVSAVHVFDRATAGAIIAIALVYLKSGDRAIARKIDVPDTEAQFDHVRPDILLLRATAKHLILWDNIRNPCLEAGLPQWIQANLPECYRSKLHLVEKHRSRRDLLTTTDVPFYNIMSGLAWALALKFAGSAHSGALAEVIYVIDRLYMLKEGGDYYYDAKLARATIRRCIDTCALSAAMIMAGTGDLTVFRYLRRLHGRTDADTPYGSHMAAHLGIGLLFLGGGTYTLGTSDLAIAMMLCAFYPLFPVDVQDNRCHLQAFRHLWIFAAEARCFVTEDIDTQRPVSLPILVTTKGVHEVHRMHTPCLLPDLERIAKVETDDPSYWQVTLDFEKNSAHLKRFRHDQRVLVRRCPAGEAHHSVFSSTLAALGEARIPQGAVEVTQKWQTVFQLQALREIEKADIELILPPDMHSSIHADQHRTAVDDRLALSRAVGSYNAGELWNVKALLIWAERCRQEPDQRLRWIGGQVFDTLKACIEDRARSD